jgi:hypothetical protein
VCDICVYVLCLIAVPLPPGKNPFAVQINYNNNIVTHTRENLYTRNQRTTPTPRHTSTSLGNILDRFALRHITIIIRILLRTLVLIQTASVV